jgi:hypothetical protein
MTTVWIYVDTNHRVGHPDHLKVFATPDAADEWFKENDPKGVAFGYEVSGNEARPRSYCPICGALIDTRDLGQVLAHVHDAEIEVGEEPEPPLQ